MNEHNHSLNQPNRSSRAERSHSEYISFRNYNRNKSPLNTRKYDDTSTSFDDNDIHCESTIKIDDLKYKEKHPRRRQYFSPKSCIMPRKDNYADNSISLNQYTDLSEVNNQMHVQTNQIEMGPQAILNPIPSIPNLN